MTTEETTGSRALTPSQLLAVYNRIGKSGDAAWQGWLTLYGGIEERRDTATRKTGTTRGTTYAAALERALGQFHPTFKRLSDNGTLTALGHIMANLEAVEAWRARAEIEERPSSPKHVWASYQESLRSTPEFKDAAYDTDDEDDDTDDEDTSPRRGRAARRNVDADDARRIEELEEQVSKVRMTADPEINAQHIWFGLQEAVGHEAAIGLARATITKLAALLDRVEDPGTWDSSPQ